MVFMDGSGNMDRHDSFVYFLMTHSCGGGVPLGKFITMIHLSGPLTKIF